jgi:CBS domain-containing protein
VRCLWSGRPASSSVWYHDLTSSRKRPGWPPPRDCARGSGRGAGSALARTAGELMTAPAVTVAPQATVEQAARLMRRHRVGRLPVTSPLTGRLAGIVTRSDLLRVYRRPGEEIRAEIETEVLPRVRGADPRRLAVSVRDGVVSISGRVEARSAVARLVSAVLAVEGVVGVDERPGFDLDDATLPSRSPSDRRTRAASRGQYGQAAFRSSACRET